MRTTKCNSEHTRKSVTTNSPAHNPRMRLRAIEKALLAELGKSYTSKWIDGIEVIYRDLNRFDMEATCDPQRRHYYITVWQKQPLVSVENLEGHFDSLYQVRTLIEALAAKYQKEEPVYEKH